jgi:hypothetical protein
MLPPGTALPAVSPFVVMLVILAGASAFAIWQAHAEPPQASPGTAARAMAESGERGLPSVPSMPATPQNPGSGGPSPSNDADSEEDGTGDSLEVSVVIAFLVLLSRDGGLLLAFCDVLAKLFSGCNLASERPG